MRFIRTSEGQELEILAIHAVPFTFSHNGPTGTSYTSHKVESWATVRDNSQKVSTIKIDGLTITGE